MLFSPFVLWLLFLYHSYHLFIIFMLDSNASFLLPRCDKSSVYVWPSICYLGINLVFNSVGVCEQAGEKERTILACTACVNRAHARACDLSVLALSFLEWMHVRSRAGGTACVFYQVNGHVGHYELQQVWKNKLLRLWLVGCFLPPPSSSNRVLIMGQSSIRPLPVHFQVGLGETSCFLFHLIKLLFVVL